MITQLRIQNFKSLRDVTLDLQRVNLLIGPNNCGKTNVLKALKFFSEFLGDKLPDKQKFQALLYRENREGAIRVTAPMILDVHESVTSDLFAKGYLSVSHRDWQEIRPYWIAMSGISTAAPTSDIDVMDVSKLDKTFDTLEVVYWGKNDIGVPAGYSEVNIHSDEKYGDLWFRKTDSSKSHSYAVPRSVSTICEVGVSYTVLSPFKNLYVYKPDPTKLLGPYPVVNEESVAEDASNLVAFLHIMRNKYHDVYKRIEEDLQRFVPEFTAISFEIVDVDINDPVRIKYPDKSYEKIGLLDNQKRTFWAEDLSEGILYFLALLAIIHQPNPPKLLLLEEPEKGIHPRRIREVLDLICELAEEKDIQVIMTTHSPLVVDRFSDIPESVFILEKPENETIVKNLQRDVIEPMNEKFREAGEEPIPYTEALGEHWAMGFLGGVPNEYP